MKNKNIIIITISLMLGMFTSYLSISRSIKTTINITDMQYEKNYKVNFKSKTKIPPNANTYIVKNNDLNIQYLNELALKFSLPNVFTSNDIKHTSGNEFSKLTIFKKDNLMKFVTINYEKTTDTQTLINKAIQILEQYNLNIIFDDVFCNKTNNIYEVIFISKIGGIKNYAFTNKVIFDFDASLLTIEVYLNSFEKLGSLKIISINDALKNIKSFDTPKIIELTNYELVYTYNKSILEPAYKILTQDNKEIYLGAYD